MKVKKLKKIKLRRGPKQLKPADYTARWLDLQKHCASRKTWSLAIVEADELLSEALKKARFRGKTTGERLVAAQHLIKDNEAAWFSHKFSTKIVDVEDVRKLKKQDVFEALTGFRQTLRDLGALEK